jgi:CII-binding regulator of phage lambda lysogenization HflD
VEQRLETFKLLPDALTTKLSRFDSLEQKLDAIQRAPADISQRLDQIQSLVADRSDVATEPMSSNVKALLRSLAARLETMQSAPVDERALQRLQKDIRALLLGAMKFCFWIQIWFECSGLRHIFLED